MMGTLRIGRVAAVHPEDHSVDLVMADDFSRLAGVQVLAYGASGNTGLNSLPLQKDPGGGDKWQLSERTERDLIAVVGFVGMLPVVVGFLYPQVCEMLFADQNRRIDRHSSDVYTSIDGDGNTEIYHPSGTYLRIGTDAAHEDLTAKDADKKWAIKKNTDKAVHVSLRVSNAGAEKASISIDPSGNVVLSNLGNLSSTTQGSATVNVTGNTTVTSPTVTINGNLVLNGTLSATGGAFTHNGVNIGATHQHSGVQSGASNTGAPI